jgi:hypothetical protein
MTVPLGGFSLESIGGWAARDGRVLGCSFALAIRHYLANRSSERAGWPYPPFPMGDGRGSNSTAEAEFCIDGAVWDELSDEAARQEVPAEELLRHVVLFFMVDRDSGRVARRMVESRDWVS